MEEQCNEDYKSKTGHYPEWHFQSPGKGKGPKWPAWIMESWKKYRFAKKFLEDKK